jgi:hypothetical protein
VDNTWEGRKGSAIRSTHAPEDIRVEEGAGAAEYGEIAAKHKTRSHIAWVAYNTRFRNTHPTDSFTLLPCPFRHNHTLQD